MEYYLCQIVSPNAGLVKTAVQNTPERCLLNVVPLRTREKEKKGKKREKMKIKEYYNTPLLV